MTFEHLRTSHPALRPHAQMNAPRFLCPIEMGQGIDSFGGQPSLVEDRLLIDALQQGLELGNVGCSQGEKVRSPSVLVATARLCQTKGQIAIASRLQCHMLVGIFHRL